MNGSFRETRQRVRFPFIINRAAIVGIDQAEIPQLGSLVEIGHARSGQLEGGLHQRQVHSAPGDLGGERQEIFPKGSGPLTVQNRIDEIIACLQPGLIGLAPVGMRLRFRKRLVHIIFDPVTKSLVHFRRFKRPRAEQNLI